MLAGIGTVSDDYYDRKDRRKRTGRVVAVVLFVVLLTLSFVLYLEISGSKGGEFIDRMTVRSYLRRNYGSELNDLQIEFKGYNKVRRRYEYECTCDKGTFTMGSKNFRVKFDGYYADYLCDKTADQTVLEAIRSYMTEKWPEAYEGAELEVKLRIRVPFSDGADVSNAETLLKEYGSSMEMEFSIYGKKLTFSEYKLCSYALIDTLRGTLKVAPEFIQIFYFRDPEGSETGPVMSYESELYGYMVNYNRDAYLKATDINFVVELGSTEEKSLRNYTIIKVVNFVVIGLVVIGLSALIIVRRILKKRKESEQK